MTTQATRRIRLNRLLTEHTLIPARVGRGMGDSPDMCICGRWDAWKSQQLYHEHLTDIVLASHFWDGDLDL